MLLSWLPLGSAWTQDQAATEESKPTESAGDSLSVDSELLAGLKLRPLGPALMSGRIADIAVNPEQPNTWYVAAGSGNLWKTTNAGTTWTPIFENYDSYSIGCVTLDPSNPNIVWVGTGENVGGRHVGFGDGVYVSHDAGGSFKNLGLKESAHISKVLVHPEDSQVVLVAAQGPLWSKGGERGLYRTTDGGETWDQVLAAGPWTGCTDVVVDPENPETMYAALHQRHRTVAALLNTGPESGIYKSTDGGETWKELTNGLPGQDMGKISLAVSPQKSNIVYATVELPAQKGGTWRSVDYGASWKKVSDFVSGGTGPHYYQEIWADPHRFNCLYHANNYLSRSLDGGETWDNVEGQNKHVDNHAIAFHPSDPDFVICGTDGGVYYSYDFTTTWKHVTNLPLTQFYKVDVDYDLPFYHVVGGTQDNSTQYGPARTRESTGIANGDWIIPIGGDGHDNAINPDNPDIIYCESQEGYIRRFDRRTGQSVSIRPAPAAGEPEFRFNWDSPILISPHDSSRIYFASNFLHRSDNHGDSWSTISPDLSRGENRLAMKMMDRKHGVDAGYDLYAMSQYGNITSISESPIVEGLIYVGTDDGLIQVTEDGGKTWRKIDRIYGIPEMAFINDIKADRHDADTVYACLDHHKSGDFKPYLIRSADRGKTWESIAGDLPDRHLVWRIEQDHQTPELLFLGTEFGLFVSVNSGENWSKLSGGMPTIPVRDLAIQKREHDLVLATFGRSFYVLDDYSPLRKLVEPVSTSESAQLFAPRNTAWYRETRVRPVSSLGDSYFTASNPPAGVIFTLHVEDWPKTSAEQRKAAEAKAAKANEDVEIPSFEELAKESAEEKPQLYIEIRDQQGNLVKRLDCPTSKGLHRVVWDMRETSPIIGSPTTLVAPGEYTAQLVRVAGETVEAIATAVDVQLQAIYESSLDPVKHEEAQAFNKKVATLLASWRKTNTAAGESSEELSSRKQLVLAAGDAPQTLLASISELESLQRSLELKLSGDQERRSRNTLDVPTAGERLQTALYQAAGSLHGPTGTSREQVEIAQADVAAAEAELAELEGRLESLRAEMESAGLLWVK
ncbi:VPS10 domain-containing protein [Planctomycetaceae bacterium SH139]